MLSHFTTSFIKRKLKVAFYLLQGFLLYSCSSSSWMVSAIYDDHHKQKSSSLTYTIEDGFSSLELEFDLIDGKLFSYIQASEFKNTHQDASIPIGVQIDSIDYSYTSHLHKGKERICLPSSCTNKMIEALKKNKPITLSILDIEENIERQDFEKKFEKFMNQNHFFDTILDIYEKILEEPA